MIGLGAIAGQALSGALSKQSGGGSAGGGMLPSMMTGATEIPIHVAPVGVNFGSIVSPFNQGSPENGGYGIDYSRYKPLSDRQATIIPAKLDSADLPLYVMIAAGLGVGYYLLTKTGVI